VAGLALYDIDRLAAPGWIACGHARVECELRPTLQRIGVADQAGKRVGPLFRRDAGAFLKSFSVTTRYVTQESLLEASMVA
jgi:hypothetical protein